MPVAQGAEAGPDTLAAMPRSTPDLTAELLTKATTNPWVMFFLINEMIVPGSNYWNIVFAHDPGDAMNDTEGIATVRLFAENVAELVRHLSQ